MKPPITVMAIVCQKLNPASTVEVGARKNFVALNSNNPMIFKISKFYSFVPKDKSPASPSPGTMYD